MKNRRACIVNLSFVNSPAWVFTALFVVLLSFETGCSSDDGGSYGTNVGPGKFLEEVVVGVVDAENEKGPLAGATVGSLSSKSLDVTNADGLAELSNVGIERSEFVITLTVGNVSANATITGVPDNAVSTTVLLSFSAKNASVEIIKVVHDQGKPSDSSSSSNEESNIDPVTPDDDSPFTPANPNGGKGEPDDGESEEPSPGGSYGNAVPPPPAPESGSSNFGAADGSDGGTDDKKGGVENGTGNGSGSPIGNGSEAPASTGEPVRESPESGGVGLPATR